jgi:hypothetical protein
VRDALFFTLFFQSTLAIFQFYSQRPLFGYLFFGETAILKPFGINTGFLLGSERILPYGTTPHPNILGGILAIYLILGWYLIKKNNYQARSNKTIILVSGTTLWALFLTQSISAWLTLVLASSILFIKPISQIIINHATTILLLGGLMFALVPVLINQAASDHPSNQSLQRRSYLNLAAFKIIVDQPLTGIGLNQFTNRVEEYSNVREVVRFVQPVHHLGLLYLAETGLLGMSLVAAVLTKTRQNKLILPFLVLLPIATLDHYLLTLNQGLLLGVLVLTILEPTTPNQ